MIRRVVLCAIVRAVGRVIHNSWSSMLAAVFAATAALVNHVKRCQHDECDNNDYDNQERTTITIIATA